MADEVALHADIVRTVVEYLRSGISVNVVGMRSSGRSGVLRRVSELLADDGLTSVQVSGVAALQDRPLASLAVGGVEVPNSPTGGSLSAAVTALERRVTSRPSVLVIDDVESVDQVSAGVVAAVRRRVSVPVLVASRPAGRRQVLTSPITVELQPAARVVLPPLRYDAVHGLVHEMLVGAVEPSALARIATESGGMPGLVAALVDTGRRTGRLIRRDSLWVIRGGLWDPSLAQAVEPLLDDVDEEALDALTLLSFAGTLELSRARAVVPWNVLTRLDDAGLVQVLESGEEPAIAVFPPLVGEYLRSESSAIRRVQASEELLRLLGDLSATWRPIPSMPPSAPALDGTETVVGRQFAESWHLELESRRAAWIAEPTASTAVPLVMALLGAPASAAEVDTVLDDTQPTPEDPRAEAFLIVWHAVDLGLRRNKVSVADEMLAHAAQERPDFAGLFQGTRAHLMLVTSAVPGQELLYPEKVGEDPINLEALRACRAESLLATGQVDAALAELVDYHPTDLRFQLSARLSRSLAAIFGGNPEEGLSRALGDAQAARAALDPGGYQAHAYVAALGLTMVGRLDEVDRLVASVLTLPSTQTLQSHFRDGVLTMAAVVASLQGRTAYAHGLARQAAALGVSRGPYPSMVPDLAPVLVGGPEVGSADLLWEAVEERMAAGMPVAAVGIAVFALERKPDAARAEWLRAQVKGTGSRLVEHLIDYCTAVGSQDAEALAKAVVSLRAADLGMYSTRAGVARALALRGSGDFDEAARQAEESWGEAALYATDVRGLFAPLAQAVDLTVREREIAVMVSEGMQTAEIAATLVLSVRTVENHLLNAFRKVGVDNREALARAVDTWASAGTS